MLKKTNRKIIQEKGAIALFDSSRDENITGIIKVDMHCHSSFSDGETSPEDLAEKLFKSGVQYAALTDHDSLAGLEPFKQSMLKYGLGFITGIELTTIHETHIIHLLAYGFDPNNKELGARLDEVKMINDPAATAIPSTHISTKDAIKVVHDAGGLALLAHPLKTEGNFEKLSKIVNELQEFGLDGIEGIYAADSNEERKKLLNLAQKNGLVVSAGTDYHSAQGEVGIEIKKEDWKNFRNAIIDISLRNSNKNTISSPNPPKKNTIKWFSFIFNIVLPASLALILFIIALFSLLLPYFEQTLLERKRDSIRDLTRAALGVLEEASYEVESKQLTLEQAQELAKKRIEAMRYGREGKEYFWLQDLTPKILMHPYRPDLIDKDVSEFKDARNVKIFVEFVNLVKEKKEGFISYVWQWRDEKDRLEAKESYISLFEKWNWVIGTGIYDQDVKDEISNLRGHFIKLSLSIVVAVLLLLTYLVRNGLKLEKSRMNAEKLLFESIKRYRALTEAATEGALYISKSHCRYANAVMYELLGCNESHLELLEIDDIFPDVEANSIWRDYLKNTDSIESKSSILGIIKRCDGSFLNCSLTLRCEISQSGIGFMVLVRRNIEGNEFTERKLDLDKLLQLPKSIASDLTDAISKARQVDDVVVLCTKTQELVHSLLENASSSIEITRMLSTVTDAATKKLIEIAINEIGVPPTAFAFLGLGSHGRESQTLYSDQDNAIIFRLEDNMDKNKVQEYFLNLANIVCEGLELAGYRKCNGEKMANNPEWCQPLQVWKQYFQKWIKHCEPKDIMEFSVFFDFRAVAGDFELAKELRIHVNSILVDSPTFFIQVAKNTLLFNPPISLFGTILTSRDKEYPGRLDVKSPTMAIVSFARLYALKQSLLETNTLARLDAITRTGILLDSTRRDIVTSYESLLRFRLWNQSLALQNNQELSNWIDPGQLGHIEEVILKECFKEIELLQGRIQRDFFGGSTNF